MIGEMTEKGRDIICLRMAEILQIAFLKRMEKGTDTISVTMADRIPGIVIYKRMEK